MLYYRYIKMKGKYIMMNVINVIDYLVDNKCEIKLDSFKYNKISRGTEQVGEISAYDKLRIAYEVSNAKNAVEVHKITEKASEIAYEKSHLNFVWDKTNHCASSVNFNETRPNVSISFNIDGTIKLPSDAPNHLPKDFKTFVFRNFNIIHDGILNITSLIATMDKSHADYLRSNGVSVALVNGNDYSIDFTSIPLFTLQNNAIKAMDVADITYKVMENKAFIKVAKHFLEKLNPVNKSQEIASLYGNDVCEYLKYLGITDYGFNPKSKAVASTTSYQAKELLLKFKGMSNIPSYNAFLKKVNEGKKLNNADNLLKKANDICESNEKQMSNNDFIAFLKAEINRAEKENKHYNKLLTEIRFNVIVGNKWFDEFTTNTNGIINYNGIDVEFIKQDSTVEM